MLFFIKSILMEIKIRMSFKIPEFSFGITGLICYKCERNFKFNNNEDM